MNRKVKALLMVIMAVFMIVQVPSLTTEATSDITNLNQTVTDVVFEGQNDDGSMTLVQGKDYSMKLSFKESGSEKQFANGSILTYVIPDGITLVGPTEKKEFSIAVDYLGQIYNIEGNTFIVNEEERTLKVEFNQNDPNYDILTYVTMLDLIWM